MDEPNLMNGRPPNNVPQGPDQPAYTIPGILNFIKHEWTRFEKERANWDAEKTELQVRYSEYISSQMINSQVMDVFYLIPPESCSFTAFSLQAKIAFLEGERRGQENLKRDLVRRIKMLEYALKQER